MKRILVAAMLTAAAMTATGYAADKPLTPQQQKMKDCNAEAKAKALKGDERKSFMKACLGNKGKGAEPATPASAEAPAAPATPAPPASADKKAAQQDKMKSCNAEAKSKGLKGDERKKFMSDCLKG